MSKNTFFRTFDPIFLENESQFSTSVSRFGFYRKEPIEIIYYWSSAKLHVGQCILHTHLCMRKFYARWVARLLIIDQKCIRMTLWIGLVVEIRKKRPHLKKKKNPFSWWQCSITHIEHCTGKKAWIGFRIASASTVFSRYDPQWLLSVPKPQEMAVC